MVKKFESEIVIENAYRVFQDGIEVIDTEAQSLARD
jgi:hypothetical protein